MLLSTVSWFAFNAALVIATMSATFLVCEIVAAIVRTIRHKPLSGLGSSRAFDRAFGAFIMTVMTGILLASVASGGHKAWQIYNNLTNQGLHVVSIETTDSTAEIAVGEVSLQVSLQKDPSGLWQPFVLCPVAVTDGALTASCHP